jgi:hypothetical protein
MDYLPTAAEVATLTLCLGRDYAEEKGTRLTRFRISTRSLRQISGRSHLRDVFLEDWAAALDQMGWKVICCGDHNGLIREDAIDGWSRLSSKRIASQLKGVNAATIRRLRRRLRESEFA